MSLANPTHTIKVYRRSNTILSSTDVLSTLTTTAPASGSIVSVRLSNGDGDVTVKGASSTGASSETLSFDSVSPTTKTTKEIFDFLDGSSNITTTGLVGDTPTPTITVTATGAAGEWSGTWSQVQTSFPVKIITKNSSMHIDIPGVSMSSKTAMFVGYQTTYTPQQADLVIDNYSSIQYLIKSFSLHKIGFRHLHYECELIRRDGSNISA